MQNELDDHDSVEFVYYWRWWLPPDTDHHPTRGLSLSQQWTLIINISVQFFIWKNYVPISTYNYCSLLFSSSSRGHLAEDLVRRDEEPAKTGITAVMIRSMGYFYIHSATVQFCNLQQNPLKNHNL